MWNRLCLLALSVLLLSVPQPLQAALSTDDMATKAAATPHNIFELDTASFKQIVEGQREYAVVVVMTALSDQIKCFACQSFAPEYEILASSYRRSGDLTQEPPVYFGNLDFANGREVFQKMEVSSAPTAWIFPPTLGPHAPKNFNPIPYDFNRHGLRGEGLAEYLEGHFKRPFPFERPINYMEVATKAGAILAALGALFLTIKYAKSILMMRRVWAAGSLVAILMMTSGHMWNRIRSPPYLPAGGDGRPEYFSGGFQNQNGIEPQIIAGMYGILAFGTICLITRVPGMSNGFARRTATYFWLGLILITYSALLVIFRKKNGGYPFRLFL